jgi:tetratricopeptide (TPR) repeat protein
LCDFADKRLIKVCGQCIEPLPKDRPRSVEVLAEAVAASLTASEGSAHRAQLYAIQAQAEAEEQRRSRRQTLVVLSVILGMILLGVGVLLWMDAEGSKRDRERRTAAEAALHDAARLSAAGKWDEALAAAERAAELGEDRSLIAQIRSEQQQALAGGRIAGADEVFLDTLEEPRELYGLGRLAEAGPSADEEDRAVDAAYLEHFKQRFGSVVKGRDPLASSKLAREFAACLGFWSSLRRGSEALKGAGWKSLDSLACAVDPASAEAREALGSVEGDGLLAAATKRAEALPLSMVSEVGFRLTRLGRAADAVAFLTPWQQKHPDDYWINVQLAAALLAVGEARPATRHAFAAVALRPESASAWIRLGLYYKEAGDFVDGIYALRRAGELAPDHPLTAAALRAVETAQAERGAAGR